MSDVTTKTILEVSGLTVSFERATGSTTVVNDVSFEVLEGETLGIVGKSDEWNQETRGAKLKRPSSNHGLMDEEA